MECGIQQFVEEVKTCELFLSSSLPPSTGRLLFLSVTTWLIAAAGVILIGVNRTERQQFGALALSLLAKVTGAAKPSASIGN